MKKYILIALFLGFSFPVFLQTAKAQSFDKFQTEIPFEFSIGDETFKAGKYTLFKVKTSSEPQIFRLVDKTGKTLAIFSARSDYNAVSNRQNGVSLIFKRSGEILFLAGIKEPSNTFLLEASENQIEMAKKRKRNAEDSTLVSMISTENR